MLGSSKAADKAPPPVTMETGRAAPDSGLGAIAELLGSQRGDVVDCASAPVPAVTGAPSDERMTAPGGGLSPRR